METEESSKLLWSRSYSSSSSSSNPNSSSSNFKTFILAFISASIISLLFFPSLLTSFPFSSIKSFRPSLLKNGWDLLNFLLVLFAVLCGVLGRNHSDNTSAASLSSAAPSQHHPNPMATASANVDGTEWGPLIRRMPSSRSYPDLRQEQRWTQPDNNPSWQRFNDDCYISNNNSFSRRSGHLQYDHSSFDDLPYDRHQQSTSTSFATEEIKTAQAEVTKESAMEDMSRSPLPPPPPPLPPPRMKHEHQQRRRRKRSNIPDPPPPPPPPRQQPMIPDPPPLPLPTPPRPKVERKKNTIAKDIGVEFPQFYQKKRKRSSIKTKKKTSSIKTKKKTQDNNNIMTYAATMVLVPSAPPGPPPPPPETAFDGLFSNKSKKKNIPYPPPLPKFEVNYPPPISSLNSMPHQPSNGLPPKVPEREKFSYNYYNSDSSEILPPPLPRLESASDSPAYGNVSQQVFCPSPDLNVKAERFIKRFHDGLKLEKICSIKEKERLEKEKQHHLAWRSNIIELTLLQQGSYT